MKFAMFIVHGDDTVTAADEAAAPDAGRVVRSGRRRVPPGRPAARPARPPTVARRAGRPIVTDGPFAETREWIAGFALLECDSLAEAVELAGRNPAASYGRVEVRPVHSSTLDD